MTDHLFVLGASDPEMSAIETLLTECGVPFVCAMIGDRRVSAGEAYKYAEIDIGFDAKRAVIRDHGTLHLVECDVEIDPEDVDIVTVLRHDHHRPGDPGFGRGPEDFFEASSIGQVIQELGDMGLLPAAWERRGGWTTVHGFFTIGGEWTLTITPPADIADHRGAAAPEGDVRVIPSHLVLAAAADHCLAHAYAGRCPGVDPDELMSYRVAQRARFQGRSATEIMADIEIARMALESAPHVELGVPPLYGPDTPLVPSNTLARDLRGTHVSELPEAGTRYGVAYVADGLPGPDGRVKIVCSGPKHVIEAFLVWAPRNLLVDCYGDPARGFAGAYQVPCSECGGLGGATGCGGDSGYEGACHARV